ncbi:MAG TPA: GNAT family N-acetyltransferase [Xanthobacteraceae bacterium]
MTGLDYVPSETFRESCIPVLETERLVLRAPRLGDAKTVTALANDRHIAENTARIPHPYRLTDAKDWIAGANKNPDDEQYVITLASGTLIGACGLEMRDGPPPAIGYWLGQAYRGKGYATEAVHALIDHAFDDLEHEALQSSARVTNPASRRVLEKCGFQWTGVGLCRIRAIHSSAPVDRFRLERGIWASLKSWGKTRRVR